VVSSYNHITVRRLTCLLRKDQESSEKVVRVGLGGRTRGGRGASTTGLFFSSGPGGNGGAQCGPDGEYRGKIRSKFRSVEAGDMTRSNLNKNLFPGWKKKERKGEVRIAEGAANHRSTVSPVTKTPGRNLPLGKDSGLRLPAE